MVSRGEHLRNLLRAHGLDAMLLAIVLLVAWRSINYVSSMAPWVDSSIFLSMGYHLLHGKVLYRDIWDHKPPVVYALNALALFLGGPDVNAVRTMERLFAMGGGAAFFLLMRQIFQRRWLALLATVLFLDIFYSWEVYQEGNFAEEYGAVFLLCAVCALLFSRRTASPRGALGLHALAGALYSVTVMSKEPFVFAGAPWFLYALLAPCPALGARWKRAAALTAGAAVPVLLMLGYFAAHGALPDLADAYSYKFQYAKVSAESNDMALIRAQQRAGREAGGVTSAFSRLASNARAVFLLQEFGNNRFLLALFALGILSLCSRGFLRKTAHVPLVLGAWFLADFFGTTLGRGRFMHYYLQLVSSYALLCGAGLAFLAHLAGRVLDSARLGRQARAAILGAAVLALAGLFYISKPYWERDLRRLAAPAGKYSAARNDKFPEMGELIAHIRSHSAATDRVWQCGFGSASIYLESGRLSPGKYYFVQPCFFLDTYLSTGDEKIQGIFRDLERDPPRLVVVPEGEEITRLLLKRVFAPWLERDYRLDRKIGRFAVYARK